MWSNGTAVTVRLRWSGSREQRYRQRFHTTSFRRSDDMRGHAARIPEGRRTNPDAADPRQQVDAAPDHGAGDKSW